LTIVTVASVLLAPGLADANVRVQTVPGLMPRFNLRAPDYVSRCDPPHPLRFTVDASGGDAVSIGRGRKRTGHFAVEVPLAANHAVSIRATAGGRASTHHVRCLPQDFPSWTVHRHRRPESQWYVLTPVGQHSDGYVAIFDTRGVPVWWMHSSWYAPWDGKLLPDGNLAWSRSFGTEFGLDPRGGAEEHALDGRLLRVLQTHGTPTDFHDVEQMPNGNYLLDSYARRPNVNLTRFGGPSHALVYDAEIQELTPKGTRVWSWNSKNHVHLSENTWWKDIETEQNRLPPAQRHYDAVHINSMEPDGDGIIVSARFLDAVFRIDLKTKRITWKLGGTRRRASLAVKNDPLGTRPFGGQHDARLYRDGTLTVYDNGAAPSQRQIRPPRAVRYRIDTANRTATLLESVRDHDVPKSGWGGGARKLAGGDWVVYWGSTNRMTELTSASRGVLEVKFGGDRFGYRSFPIPHARISAQQLRRSMDAVVRAHREDVPRSFADAR
jgi:arylsulfotransferase ASST